MNEILIAEQIKNYRGKSFSQLKQDIAALIVSNYKKNGFFVEFGACDGLHLSNTFMLEKDYGWNGILAEPSVKFNKQLEKNRSTIIDKRAVYSTSGQILTFKETDDQLDLSGLADLFSNDNHVNRRKNGTLYEVKTVSLLDLLNEHKAPRVIDFVSMDTEGSEYEILKNFDFSAYQINFITVEHNYIKDKRLNIQNLMESKNFKKILSDVSEWDDWYIPK